ncbi:MULTISPECIES: hypothetical protein [Bacillus cereus group]|uniref:Uncharacterized protein n=1 Tax=Bacillus mycoides TaxID=1405 RepID=A0A1E8BNY2_BACMY|nr:MULTISPECIES: hypothetical protein [Bacillus cereus group]EJV62585.1 hypothetical protein IEM_03043 [Bacillus cereus BAG6O-2]OFD45016.1 hypothetical protein BWGOE2_22770 [Bacillus mycoides]OFD47853.1 hypothetical protein BWGOE1_23330 [Bacillus mycoides]OFD49441.1 hypothetical protein BWGOE3_22720 [Bacillus mycoides]OFD60759.1 hypothetical protein BWGOE6_23540 [Bacillus mycoides]
MEYVKKILKRKKLGEFEIILLVERCFLSKIIIIEHFCIKTSIILAEEGSILIIFKRILFCFSHIVSYLGIINQTYIGILSMKKVNK